MMARAVSSRVNRSSIQWTPRAVLATSVPIDVKATATIASATSASISVKPVLSLSAVEWDNLDPSRQPIDAHFITSAQTA